MNISLKLNIFELNSILASLEKSSKSLSTMTKEYKETSAYLINIRDKLLNQAKTQGLLSDFVYAYKNNDHNRKLQQKMMNESNV